MHVAPKLPLCAVKRPVKELRGFRKVEVMPGAVERITVNFELKYGACYFDEARRKWCVEAGPYDVIVSNTSAVEGSNALVRSFYV